MSQLSKPIIVAILAGGKARRFGGQDKGEILIGEQRLIDIIYKRIKSQASDIIISGDHDYDLGLDVVPDCQHAPGGPVGGIYSIWKTLESYKVDGFFTVAVDGPNVPLDILGRLHGPDSSNIVRDDAGRHPTYGWWRMADLAIAWDNINHAKSISLNQLAELVGAQEITWEGDDSFLNINRKSDLSKYVKGP